ncbi:MAG: acyltransferase [Bacteroidales bacterium]|jgi:phenylacetate-coenzyme A ligase PaaK-like adenylate-forming protein
MIMQLQNLQKRIFNIGSTTDFWETTLEVFNYQYHNNTIYHNFIKSLGKDSSKIKIPYEIPFLPVEFFRNHKIVTGDLPVEMIFESSGTTGVTQGKHFVNNLRLYEESFLRSFRLFYGEAEQFLIVALLPSYTEREGSSLVYMADNLIKRSQNPHSGFYKDDIERLILTIKRAKEEKQKVLLLGVSFALLDLAENYSPDLSGVIVMETGGMKGRRKELTRSELHNILKEKLNLLSIHSEYGMTELLSQAYSKGEGIFYCPPWMKIIIRDPQDPLTTYNEPGITGGINIIDLANINSCSFIATDDLGKLHEDSGFEVLGRFDNSDIRGCNLMVE